MNLLSLGRSAAIQALRERLEKVSQLSLPLLLIGPTGSGAELCARFLHRAGTPWLQLDHPEKLAEAPLELLEQARDGLLFVPEVAELGKTAQKGLLLLIGRAQKYGVRVVCASRQHLPQLVQQGQFDEGLLQVLSSLSLTIPPLSEHREDIPDLAKAMATVLAEGGEAPYRDFDIGALNALRNADWPGNLTQLNQVVRNLMLTSLGERVTLEEVQRVLSQYAVAEPVVVETANDAPDLGIDLDMPLREARDAFERLYFEHHIAKAGGNMSKVAEAVELERTHLYRKLKQLNIRTKQ